MNFEKQSELINFDFGKSKIDRNMEAIREVKASSSHMIITARIRHKSNGKVFKGKVIQVFEDSLWFELKDFDKAMIIIRKSEYGDLDFTVKEPPPSQKKVTDQ